MARQARFGAVGIFAPYPPPLIIDPRTKIISELLIVALEPPLMAQTIMGTRPLPSYRAVYAQMKFPLIDTVCVTLVRVPAEATHTKISNFVMALKKALNLLGTKVVKSNYSSGQRMLMIQIDLTKLPADPNGKSIFLPVLGRPNYVRFNSTCFCSRPADSQAFSNATSLLNRRLSGMSFCSWERVEGWASSCRLPSSPLAAVKRGVMDAVF